MKFHTDTRKARTFWFVLLATFVALATLRPIYAAPGDDQLSAGQTQFTTGDYANAIATLQRYVEAYPNSTNRNTAELYLGASYLALHNGEVASETNAARQHFKYILDQGTSARFYLDAYFHNARSYFCEKNYGEAQRLLRGFVTAYPEDSFSEFAYYYLGICAEDAGNIQDAISYFHNSYTKFPNTKQPELKLYCRLEEAILQGKLGKYLEAEQQLSDVYNAQGVPVDVAGKAAMQRALLQIVQHKPEEAHRRLQEFITRYQYDPNAATNLQEAYLYDAYAYFAQHDVQNALLCIDKMQSLSSTLPPEAATLKIKLLLNLRQIGEAQSLLEILKKSDYGRDNPDIITSYQAMIDLAQGKRENVVNTLIPLLQTRRPSGNSPDVYFAYDTLQPNRLQPMDFVEACGILTLAYAGLYANSPAATSGAPPMQDENYVNQDAIFRATKAYVDKQNDPAISLVLDAIDKGRQNILSHPGASAAQTNLAIVAPNYNAMPNVMDAGTFNNPTDPSQYRAPGTQNYQQNPNYSAYSPSAGANPNAVGANNYAQNNYPQGQNNQQALATTNPATTNPATNNYAAGANYATGATDSIPTGSTPTNASGLTPYQPPQQTTYAQNGAPYAPNGAQNVNANAQPYLNNQTVAAGQQQVAGQQQAGYPNAQTPTENAANAPAVNVPLTAKEAQEALDKATAFFKNLDFERANEILLEATLKSETFWTDCPKEAARITLLRAWALFELEKYAEAQMASEDLASHAPMSTEAALANYCLGRLADQLGRSEAVAYLRESCAVDFPYIDVALYYLATNELELGSVNDAALDFERIYRDYPRSAYWSHAVWRLAKIESDLRHDRQAETLVNEALSKHPDSSIIDYLLFLKGEIALRAKDYDKALVAFDMIVDQYPDSVWYSRAKNRIAAVPERFKNVGVYLDDVPDFDVSAPPAPAATRPIAERPAANAGTSPRVGVPARPRETAPDDVDEFPAERTDERPVATPRRNSEYDDLYPSSELPAPRTATRAANSNPTSANPATASPASNRSSSPASTTRPSSSQRAPAGSAAAPPADSRRSAPLSGSTAVGGSANARDGAR